MLVIRLPEAEHYFSRGLLISKVSKISEGTALSSARIHRDLAKMSYEPRRQQKAIAGVSLVVFLLALHFPLCSPCLLVSLLAL